MTADVTETVADAGPARPGRGRWLTVAVSAVAVLAGLYGAAIAVTHAELSGGFVGWSGVVPGHSAGLAPITAAEQAQVEPVQGYDQVLWATRPGGEVTVGFDVHNGGPVPVTLLGIAPRRFLPGVIDDLAPAGVQLGPGYGQMKPFHPVALGPGDSVAVGLTERVVCDPTVRRAATQASDGYGWLGDSTSPVVLHYRVLGVSTAQTVGVASPVLVEMLYRACG